MFVIYSPRDKQYISHYQEVDGRYDARVWWWNNNKNLAYKFKSEDYAKQKWECIFSFSYPDPVGYQLIDLLLSVKTYIPLKRSIKL